MKWYLALLLIGLGYYYISNPPAYLDDIMPSITGFFSSITSALPTGSLKAIYDNKEAYAGKEVVLSGTIEMTNSGYKVLVNGRGSDRRTIRLNDPYGEVKRLTNDCFFEADNIFNMKCPATIRGTFDGTNYIDVERAD